MTSIGGANHDGASRLVVVDPTPKPQTADAPGDVRRLRSASFDAQWHLLLDDVYTLVRGGPR